MHYDSKISIKFYLNLEKGNGEVYPLYCRVVVSGKFIKKTKSEFSLGRKLRFADWNELKEEAKKDYAINEKISEIKNKLFQIKREFEYQEKDFTAKDVLDVYKGTSSVTIFLIASFQKHIERLKIRKEHKDVTIAKYARTLEMLRIFINNIYKMDDYPVHKVNYEFIANWEDFLLSRKSFNKTTTLHRNTVNNYHDCLKSVLGEAVKHGNIRVSPYESFSYADKFTEKMPLDIVQLKKIINKDFSATPRMDRVKDIFIFSCFTGLRFGDAMNLEVSSIHKLEDGSYQLRKIQNKIDGYVVLPFLKYAFDIYLKYDNDERKITGKVLPKISNQNLNAYLKDIAELSEINYPHPLTHHIARHTFGTTVCVENNIPHEVFSKWLGHKDPRTSLRYGKYRNPLLSKYGKELEAKVNESYFNDENTVAIQNKI